MDTNTQQQLPDSVIGELKSGQSSGQGVQQQTTRDKRTIFELCKKVSAEGMGSKPQMESNVVFVGMKNSGKTTLIRKILRKEGSTFSNLNSLPDVASSSLQCNPTVALEYSYGKRDDIHVTRSHIAHFWELAEGDKLLSLLDDLITMDKVLNVIFVIVLDLSAPTQSVSQLELFLAKIMELSVRVNQRLQAEHKQSSVDKFLDRFSHMKDKYEEHGLQVSGFPMCIIGNKLDILHQEDPSKIRFFTGALRYYAHMYASSLMFMCNVRGSRSNAELEMQDRIFRTWMNHYIFNGTGSMESVLQSRTPLDDYLSSLRIFAGFDSTSDIVQAMHPYVQKISHASMRSMIHEKLQQMFHKLEVGGTVALLATQKMEEYGEPLIDSMLAQKVQELEQRRIKEQERRIKEQERRIEEQERRKQQLVERQRQRQSIK